MSVTGAALFAATTVGSALVIGAVTDRVIVPAFASGDTTTALLATATLAIVAVAVVKSAGIVFRRTGGSAMALRLGAGVRRDLTEAYLRLPPSWHRQRPAGELLATLNSDVEAAFSPIFPLAYSLAAALIVVIAGVVLVLTDPVLALIGAALGPTVAWANGRFNARAEGPAMRAQQLRGTVSAVVHESVDGALVVKTLGREDAEAERLRVEAERLRDEMVELGRVRANYDPLLEALPNVATLLVILVGAMRVGAGAASIGDLVQVAYLFTLLAFPFRIIGYLFAEFPRSVVGWDRVQRVLTAQGHMRYGRATLPGTGSATAELAGVTFSYREGEDVLHEVDLTVPAGRTVALVGPTGAGKSTIASLFVRLADPRAGAVRIDGVDVRTLLAGVLARTVAVVPQETFLFDDSVRGNVTLGADFDDDEVWAALRLAQADEFVRALGGGLDTLIGERGATLSGGQRQRIALARALVRRPRLLVLDDATSSVDPTVEAAILAGLRDLQATVLVVAYRRATIELADEIIFVTDGRVVGRGAHAELQARLPAYARLVAGQQAAA